MARQENFSSPPYFIEGISSTKFLLFYLSTISFPCKNITVIHHGKKWFSLPRHDYKATKTDSEFKMKIKSWKGFEFTRHICF